MAIKVGDRIEFQTVDMINPETSTVETIVSTQEGTQYYVFCSSLNHYKMVRKDDITFYHPPVNK